MFPLAIGQMLDSISPFTKHLIKKISSIDNNKEITYPKNKKIC